MRLFICHVKHWLYVVLMMINLVFSLAFYRTLSGIALITTAILLIFTKE
jgi:polyferredoxin